MGHTVCEERRRVTSDGMRAYLTRKMGRRQSNRVLHGYPSPKTWLQLDMPVEAIMERRKETLSKCRKALNVYLSVPYCPKTDPDSCGFCLFPHEVFAGAAAVRKYVDCLRREADLFCPYFCYEKAASVFVGGGTPNILRADIYATLMDEVRRVFPNVNGTTEVSLEGVPQLFTLEKLRAMKNAGINRISVGVQQFDDELIKLSGRNQTSKQVVQALEWCEDLGLLASVDLIYGWPRQTIDAMKRGLQGMVATGVKHITHYELNLAGPSHFARYHRKDLPAPEVNIQMFRESSNLLRQAGVRQLTTYDWAKPDLGEAGGLQYEDNMRKVFELDQEGAVGGSEMWGWGFAGVSHLFGTPVHPGISYMNHTSVDEYAQSLSEGRFPVRCGHQHSCRDLRLVWLFQLSHLHSGSAYVEIMPARRNGFTQVAADDVVETFTQTIHSLQRGLPIDHRLDYQAIKAFDKLSKPIKRGADLEVCATKLTATFTQNVKSALSGKSSSFGSVSGRLETLSVHNRQMFILYPAISGEEVRCVFEGDVAAIFPLIGKKVTVRGKLTYALTRAFPIAVHLVSIDDVEVQPEDSELPTLSSLKGMIKGSPNSDTFIDEVRNEWD